MVQVYEWTGVVQAVYHNGRDEALVKILFIKNIFKRQAPEILPLAELPIQPATEADLRQEIARYRQRQFNLVGPVVRHKWRIGVVRETYRSGDKTLLEVRFVSSEYREVPFPEYLPKSEVQPATQKDLHRATERYWQRVNTDVQQLWRNVRPDVNEVATEQVERREEIGRSKARSLSPISI